MYGQSIESLYPVVLLLSDYFTALWRTPLNFPVTLLNSRIWRKIPCTTFQSCLRITLTTKWEKLNKKLAMLSFSANSGVVCLFVFISFVPQVYLLSRGKNWDTLSKLVFSSSHISTHEDCFQGCEN